jgi:hypothetical protein
MRQESTVRIYGEMISHIVPLNIHQIAEYLFAFTNCIIKWYSGYGGIDRRQQAARKDAAANR